MHKVKLTRRRLLVLAAAAALAVAAVAGTAIAALSGSVKTYTGCVVTSSGAITKVKEGDSPLGGTCATGSVPIRLSSGDITKVSVGTGLTGGGDNGDVSIGLDPKFGLRQDCASDQILKWDGSAWSCAADNDHTYTKGTGLDLNGGEFSISPDYRVKNTPDCASGQFATGFDSSGAVQCAAASARPGVWIKRVSHADAPQTDDKATVATLSVPAGSYYVSVTANAQDDFHGDNQTAIECELSGGGMATEVDGSNDDFGFPGLGIAGSDVASFAAAGTISFDCKSWNGSDHLQDVRLTALEVGGVTAG